MRSEIVGPDLLFFVFSLFAVVVLIFNTTRLNTEGRLVSRTFWPEFGYNTSANQGPPLDSYARSVRE